MARSLKISSYREQNRILRRKFILVIERLDIGPISHSFEIFSMKYQHSLNIRSTLDKFAIKLQHWRKKSFRLDILAMKSHYYWNIGFMYRNICNKNILLQKYYLYQWYGEIFLKTPPHKCNISRPPCYY